MNSKQKKEVEAYKNNVKQWRKSTGLKLYRERYKILRQNGYTSYQANTLKYQSDEKIQKLIKDRS